jgi:hypothetical protein
MGGPVPRIGEVGRKSEGQQSHVPALDAEEIYRRAVEEAKRKVLDQPQQVDLGEKQKLGEPTAVNNVGGTEQSRLVNTNFVPQIMPPQWRQPSALLAPAADSGLVPYSVKPRDSVDGIARKMGMTRQHLLDGNPEVARKAPRYLIHPGDQFHPPPQLNEQQRANWLHHTGRSGTATPVETRQPDAPSVQPPVAEQPVAPPVADQPVAPPVAEQPVAPPVAEQPVAPPVAEQPVAPPVSEQPVAPPVAEQPVAPPPADAAVDGVIAPSLTPAYQDKPAEALAALNTRLSSVTPEVQQRVLADPRVQTLVQAAANWANQPLAQDPRGGLGGPQMPGRQAAERLNQVTQQLDPRLGVAVVNAAAPAWERFSQSYQQNVGGSMLGPTGIRDLMTVADRIYATEGGQQAVARFAQMGHFDADGVRNSLAEGIGPAYALEYVRAHSANVNVAGALAAITDGIRSYANGPVANLASQFARHHQDLAWLVQNHGRAMTPEALNTAIASHVQSMGPEWQAESARLEQALAAAGARLVNQLNQVADFARSMASDPRLAGHRDALLSRTAEIAGTPAGSAGLTAALRINSELLAGAAGLRTLNTIEMLSSASNNARAANSVRRLGQEAVTYYMKRLIDDYVNADVSTPAAAETARANLRQGLREGVLGRLMGVSDKHYKMATDALELAIPRPGETPDQRIERLREFDRRLETIHQTDDGVKSFSRFTPPGQLMRVAGLALSGVTAAFSGVRAYSDPTAANNFKAAVDAIGLLQKGADFAFGLNGERTPPDHWLRHVGGTDATRIFGRLTAAADLGVAVQYLMRGDPEAAGWTGVTAAGGFMWSMGSSAWSGPVGFGLVLVGNIGLEMHRGRQEASRYETQASADFLRHSGLSDEAARALVDQSDEGHSPVPLLFEYGRHRGLSEAQTAAWLNSLTPRQLETLRNAVHTHLDGVNGDISTFTAGTPEDRQYVDQILALGRFRSPYQLLPENAVRMDGLLEALGIPQPRP